MSDLIRREDVDKAIRSICDLCGEDKKNNGVMCGACNLDSFIREFDDIPSAEPERKWIPVSEALPEDMDRLLATIVRPNGEKRVRSGHYYKGLFSMDNGDTWKETDKGLLAWMPLPEPYEVNDETICKNLLLR